MYQALEILHGNKYNGVTHWKKAQLLTYPKEKSHRLTISEATSSIRNGAMSAIELMESLLERARALEPLLKIWVTLDAEQAITEALNRDHLIGTRSSFGQLYGVPIGIKDIYYTKSLKTTACSPIYANFVPTFDATAVALLRRADGIVMGKTVTTEFACMDPSPTRNPWNRSHTPGGSSSGSAVGVAAGIFPAALGSQTAGSVLRPASYNGVVGMKPTFGRISRYGVLPVAWSLDTVGFFTHTVEDCGILLDILAGYDSNDPTSSSENCGAYSVAAKHPIVPRIGIIPEFFRDRIDSEIQINFSTTVDKLSTAGAHFTEIAPTVKLEPLLEAHRTIMSVEAASVHKANFTARPSDYGPNITSLIEAGFLASGNSYMEAQRVRRQFRLEMEAVANKFDALMTPSTTSPAPKNLTSTGDPVLQTPWTTCGFPALSLPSGLSKAGLPLGLQLVSIPFSEEKLLGVSRWCQEVLNIEISPQLPH